MDRESYKDDNMSETEVDLNTDDSVLAEPECGESNNSREIVKEKKKSAKEQLREEVEALNDRFIRLMAEYDNYRKRTDKEKQSLVSLGTALAVERLLPVLDTLEAAVAAVSADKEFKKGVEMTASMFSAKLSSLGVSEIEAEGLKFDPNLHDCVVSEESEEHGSGTVLRVMQKGYMLNGRVIRPAMVAVSV